MGTLIVVTKDLSRVRGCSGRLRGAANLARRASDDDRHPCDVTRGRTLSHKTTIGRQAHCEWSRHARGGVAGTPLALSSQPAVSRARGCSGRSGVGTNVRVLCLGVAGAQHAFAQAVRLESSHSDPMRGLPMPVYAGYFNVRLCRGGFAPSRGRAGNKTGAEAHLFTGSTPGTERDEGDSSNEI